MADAAWMQEVLEEQLQLEQEREAEFDILHRFVGFRGSGGHLDRCIHCDGNDDDDDDVYREEAQRVWAMREAEWEKERRARERLMQEVRIAWVCLSLWGSPPKPKPTLTLNLICVSCSTLAKS